MCKFCKYFDENEKWGYKGYCTYLKRYFDPCDSSCSYFRHRLGSMKMNPIKKYKLRKKHKRIRETEDFKQKLNEAVKACSLYLDLCSNDNWTCTLSCYSPKALDDFDNEDYKVFDYENKKTRDIFIIASHYNFDESLYQRFKTFGITQQQEYEIELFVSYLFNFKKPYEKINDYFKRFEFCDSFYRCRKKNCEYIWCTQKWLRLPEGLEGADDARFFIDEIKKLLPPDANLLLRC